MNLILDDLYKERREYLGDLDIPKYLEKLNQHKNMYELTIDVINIIKTSAFCGYTYKKCFDQAISKIASRFPVDENISKFITALTILYLRENKPKVSKRDVHREVASKMFEVSEDEVTNEMIDHVKNASYGDTYSVRDDSVSSWDEYFFNICRQVARNSKCISRRIGAVLVKDNVIISTGYNGPPRGIPVCDKRWELDEEFSYKYESDERKKGICPRRVIGFSSGEGIDICVAAHAEENTILNCARLGIPTKGTTMYMTCGVPCVKCLVKILNTGVSEVVVTKLSFYDESSLYLVNNSELKVRLYDFIK